MEGIKFILEAPEQILFPKLAKEEFGKPKYLELKLPVM